ncbi:LuxR C-terminal-related transcriptional regulator [Wukongibacter sp. M2B1]|uniref:helix-turn-helix domain-containing protein n=1 Tax=Wukongibacter sp. M2B1 TaxID=3088895 RepID=UPI003D7AA74D
MLSEKNFYEALLQSWERCMNLGLCKNIEKPLTKLTKNDLSKKLEKNHNMVCKFENFMDNHFNAIKNVKGDYFLLLFDGDGYILKVKHGLSMSKRSYGSFILPGISFDETSVGTNAVTFVKKFKRPIYMLPKFHYCNKLKKWHEYCIPLRLNEFDKGYVSVVSIQYPVTKALEGFVDLLEVNMRDEPSNLGDFSTNTRHGDRLTQRQYVILKMIAEGLSDENISNELKISLSTVKYHNKCIFKILNATSRVDAVIKGLLLGEISINDLYNVNV